MTVQPGEFWVADIKYTDGVASKKRPVLVLWVDGADVVVAAVTSARPRTSTDVSLREWRAAGLRVASTVRLARLDCLELSLLIHRLGKLNPADANELKLVWDSWVKPTF